MPARWRDTLADTHLAVREAMNGMFNDLLSQKLGIDGDAFSANALDDEDLLEDDSTIATGGETASARPSPGKALVRRLVQDSLLLAIAERAAIRGLLSAKWLGLGGAAVALALAAPPVVRRLCEIASPKIGALQGAPLSPLLSNIYLTAFDSALTARGHKLIRYCDDFVVPCASESEARQALSDARDALKAKRLQLHSGKTRLVSPAEGFTFLGYEFTAAGRVVPPPNIPEVISDHLVGADDVAALGPSLIELGVNFGPPHPVELSSRSLLRVVQFAFLDLLLGAAVCDHRHQGIFRVRSGDL